MSYLVNRPLFLKIPKYSDTRKIAVITLNLELSFYYMVVGPKDADKMANSVDWSVCF